MSYSKEIFPNGFTLLAETKRGYPVASMGFWLKSGSNRESTENQGVSHLIEHMLFKGTSRWSQKEIALKIERLGGSLDAYTAKDHCAYYQSLLNNRLEEGYDLLEELVFRPSFPEEEFESEKRVVVEEIREYLDNPLDLLSNEFHSFFYPNSPLGLPIAGTEERVLSFDRNAVLDTYRRIYTPANLVMTLCGEIDLAKFRRFLLEKMESWPAPRLLPPPLRPPKPARGFLFLPEKRGQRWSQSYVHLAWPLPAFQERRRYRLSILSHIVGGGFSSRLFQRLREEMGLAYSLSSFLGSYNRYGFFGIFAALNPTNLFPFCKALKEELNRLCQEGLQDEEVETARLNYESAVILGMEGTSSRMKVLFHNDFLLGHYRSPKQTLNTIRSITREELETEMRHLLKPEKMAFALLGRKTRENKIKELWND